MTQAVALQEPAKNIVEYIKRDDIIQSAERTLGARSQQYLTSILSLANNNTAIMKCEPRSVYAACLTAATLDLPINQNLGFAYIIPYNNKGKMEAQFQMGYKGFVQLAIRSGKFRSIGVREVCEGQLSAYDPFTGEPTFDFNNEDNAKIVGYMAYFELTNGFRKAFYMTKEQLEKHGKKYSQSYKKNFGVWKDNFDAMAKKTVLKMLLSKFAPLSTQMEQALIDDQKVTDDYADNKISFQVEGATVGDEPIDAQPSEDDHLDEPIEAQAVEQPAERKVEHEEKEKPDGYAYVRDEPNLDEYSDAPFEDEPDLITDKQLKMLLAITNKLPEALQAKEAQARELNYPGRSRKTFTKQEASHHIKYVQSLEESVQNA